MNVNLISMTKPAGKIANLTTNELITYVARVSNPENQENFETSEKLIRYLLKKSHWSPFEMVDVTFEIKTTRDIGRQILRHRSFSFQEFSQRYSEVDTDNFVERECRVQDTKNRQNSIVVYDEKLKYDWKTTYIQLTNFISSIYRHSLQNGIAKEQARALLPEGFTPSTMYMKGSLRSWFHYCLVRCHPGTQKEHREIADAIWLHIQDQFSCFQELNMQKMSIEYQNNFEELLKDCYER